MSDIEDNGGYAVIQGEFNDLDSFHQYSSPPHSPISLGAGLSPVNQNNLSFILAGFTDGSQLNPFNNQDEEVTLSDNRESASNVRNGSRNPQTQQEQFLSDEANLSFEEQLNTEEGILGASSVEIIEDLDEFLGPTMDAVKEALREEANSTHLKWNNVKPTDNNIFFSFNQGRPEVFEQLKNEVEYSRDRWPHKAKKEKLELCDCLELFFSSDGRVFQLFNKAIKISYEKFLGFIMTYFTCCAYGVSR